MPEGKCPKCGASFTGWALTDSQHQVCPKCGIPLEITGTSEQVIKDSGDEPVTDKIADS